MYNEVKEYFLDEEKTRFKNEKIQEYRTINKGHGRIEERIYYYSTDIQWMEGRKDWEKMNGIGMVIRKVEKDGKKTEEKAFHIGSVGTAQEYGKSVRKHWGVESLHWQLDVIFNEDGCKTRKGKAPENLTVIKRLALNVLKKDEEKFAKKSLRKRKTHALLNDEYLEYLLQINFG